MRGALVACLLLLAACAGGPMDEAPPLRPAVIDGATVRAGAAHSDVTLAMSEWPASGPPRAVLLALHGFGDHAESTFGRAAAFWAARGIHVYAYDQRGFGRNPSRAHWPGADRLISDFQDIAAALRGRHPDLPLFALGHSMGGGVALAGVGEGADVDGLILAAPAVWGGENLNLAYRAAAWSGALLAPEKRWSGEGVVRIQASDNIEALRALGRDPLVIGRPSSREFMGLIRLMDRAVSAAPHVTPPVLLLYGARDEVTPKRPVMAAYDSLPGPKAMRLYPDGWHLLFRDLQAKVVWHDVADWVTEQATRSGKAQP